MCAYWQVWFPDKAVACGQMQRAQLLIASASEDSLLHQGSWQLRLLLQSLLALS
jgi:hypothetical protein